MHDDSVRIAVTKSFALRAYVRNKIAAIGTYDYVLNGYFASTFADDSAHLHGNFAIPRQALMLPQSERANSEIVETLGLRTS